MAHTHLNPQLEIRRKMLEIKQHETRLEQWAVDILTREDEIARTRINIDATTEAIEGLRAELAEMQAALDDE